MLTVSSVTHTGKTVAANNTLETFTFRVCDHVDEFSFAEDLDSHFLSKFDLVIRIIAEILEFMNTTLWRGPCFRKVSNLSFIRVLLLHIVKSDLNCA